MIMTRPLFALAAETGEWLSARQYMLATAESCTGGLVAAAITEIAGSSAWFDRSFITYSNAAKQEMLGVSPQTLASFGAVSEETVREMVQGALAHSQAHIALAISGIAGPGGGTPGKPVGMVCFAWMRRGGVPRCETCHFAGDRSAVREAATLHALRGLMR